MKIRHVMACSLLAPLLALSSVASASVEDPNSGAAVLLKHQRDIMDATQREKGDVALVQRHLIGSQHKRANAMLEGKLMLAGLSPGRQQCTRERSLGSQVRVARCVMVVQRSRLESDVVQFLLKNGN